MDHFARQSQFAMIRHWLSVACMVLVSATSVARSADAASSVSTVSPALQQARRHMLDADINTLTFHSMNALFDTHAVTRSGPVWHLPREDHALDFEYRIGEQSVAGEEFAARTATNALLVIKHGRIVSESYLNLTNESTRFISFSMAKSITSMLIGIAVSEGHIHSLDDPIVRYLPELRGSGYSDVTIRQVMRMRSGVDYDERYDFGVQSQAQQVFENAIVQNVSRFADLAPQLKRRTQHPDWFNYSTMDTAVLGWMLERATHESIATYMTTRLWEPAGMEFDGFWIADGPPGIGRALSGMGFNATLRDFGRLGQLMLQQGSIRGRQIIPRDWIELSTASTAIEQSFGPGPALFGYGYQWWTVSGTAAYIALGLQGQFIYIDPKSDTVVVKLSHFPPGDDHLLLEETLAFCGAASAWEPRTP